MHSSTKRWLKFSAVGLGLQLLLFAFVFIRNVGAPTWVEYLYLPIAGMVAPPWDLMTSLEVGI
jgi:hypothetical protein